MDRVHICYGIADEKGSYSKFTGTSICSVFENTKVHVTVHLIHDNTLSDYNKKNFQELAQNYGQEIVFYDVSERWNYIWIRMRSKIPALVGSRCTIGMFYRLLVGELLSGVSRVIYFDSDTIINMDICNLWEIEIPDSGLAAVPDLFVQKMGDNMIKAGVVERDEYFNSGVLLLDVKKIRGVRNLIDKVLNFILRYKPNYPDQDALNFLFSHSAVLPNKYNTFVNMAIEKGWPMEKCIYHYANNALGLKMDNKFNRLYFSYFTKTPWCDEFFVGKLANEIEALKLELLRIANKCASKRRIIIGWDDGSEIVKDFLEINDNDIYIPIEKIEEYNISYNSKADIVLVFLDENAYDFIRERFLLEGLKENDDFINMSEKLGLVNGGMNEYSLFFNC